MLGLNFKYDECTKLQGGFTHDGETPKLNPDSVMQQLKDVLQETQFTNEQYESFKKDLNETQHQELDWYAVSPFLSKLLNFDEKTMKMQSNGEVYEPHSKKSHFFYNIPSQPDENNILQITMGVKYGKPYLSGMGVYPAPPMCPDMYYF